MSVPRVLKFVIGKSDGYARWAGIPVVMPEWSTILCVDYQECQNAIVLWAECRHSKEVTAHFHIAPTGDELPGVNERQYLATIQMDRGTLVWHVYRVWPR